ncbi:uncharacterized protein PGRI_062810 [Penicillium griseofulvum]|uniref:Uncharacterized protein n=1 Tax=Penicillium patulum TaxID=5078 RepID=A0A135LMZ6_PENPA|nr:uncharacterized protein PGRI_062810 [Penicillium griseofulvum]KXG50314.1 hypothetical protein PGRI_062810 [Penicillium griseofulvum]
MIAENLTSNADLNSLIQTNIHLCKLLDPLLYLRDAETYRSLAIYCAAKNGNENTARKSLQAGVRLDLCYYWSKTLLCLAAENGNDGVVKLFLASDESVDPNEEDLNQETPLLCAAKWGHEAVVKQLLLTGRVDVNFNRRGFTPLSYAAWNGHEAVVNLLLDADGINLDFAHPDGRTAIHLAAEGGHESVVKLLIAAGADLGGKAHAVTDMSGTNQAGPSSDNELSVK